MAGYNRPPSNGRVERRFRTNFQRNNFIIFILKRVERERYVDIIAIASVNK
jgi:ribosomal protein L28